MQPRVESVALLLINPAGLIYCVQELQAKPEIGKVPGTKDRSFPWETVEPGEDHRRTLQRLLTEEVDATNQVQITDPFHLGEVPVYDTLAHVYLATFVSGPEGMRGIHADIEIKPLGWRTRVFLLAGCRDGVPEVLHLWDESTI